MDGDEVKLMEDVRQQQLVIIAKAGNLAGLRRLVEEEKLDIDQVTCLRCL